MWSDVVHLSENERFQGKISVLSVLDANDGVAVKMMCHVCWNSVWFHHMIVSKHVWAVIWPFNVNKTDAHKHTVSELESEQQTRTYRHTKQR